MMFRNAVIALALVAGTASAGDFDAGNRAAVAGDAKAAAAAFERSLARGWSPGALFDLGNAYASSGDPGRAVLAYERARLLAPSNPSIAANLAQVRAEAGISAPPASAVDRTLAVLTANDWTWLALAGAVVACAGLVVAGWSTRRRLACALVASGGLAALACAFAAVRIVTPADRAIVVTRSAAHIAPAPGAETVFTAPAGEEVTVEQRHGDFVHVRDGEQAGWLPRGAVELVIPG